MSRYDIALDRTVDPDGLADSLLVDLVKIDNEDDQKIKIFDETFRLYQQGMVSIGTIMEMLNTRDIPVRVRRHGYRRIYNG